MNEAIKKQSTRNYSSFDPSPPFDEIAGEGLETLVSDCDEQKPLLVGASSCAKNKVLNGKTNELNCSVRKEICYNKIMPFPVATKDLNLHEEYGAANLGYEDDKAHESPVLECSKNSDCYEKSKSLLLPVTTKETVVLCNDLDSVCQVIPLSFSPNLYPDVGSVPLINCQVSRRSISPSHTYSSVVTTSSDNSDFFTTVLRRTKNPVSSAASWPRRRPQSLRVAICYSSPECRQEVADDLAALSVDPQEIGMRDMSHGIQDIGPKGFLKTWGSLEALEAERSLNDLVSGTESSFSHSQPDCSKLDELIDKVSVSKHKILSRLLDKEDIGELIHLVDKDNIPQDSVRSTDVSLTSQPLSQIAQISSNTSVLPQMSTVYNPPGYIDYLMSPSSDKENDPALLSVRPKIRQSPRKKKSSPKKKSKSPKKPKLGSTKEDHCKQQGILLSLATDYNMSVQNAKCGSLDDDVWAVDDFLPLPKKTFSNSLPRDMQDFEVCHSANFKSRAVSPVEKDAFGMSSKLQSDPQNSCTTSVTKDTESNMINTFSTDTGYETETNGYGNTKTENESNCANKGNLQLRQPLELNDCSFKLEESRKRSCYSSYSLATSSDFASEATTPQTVADDNTEYYSISSEMANIPYSALQNTGEDTPDYLSICSELPGIPRLLEDSPRVDLEMNQLFLDERYFGDSMPSPLDSPESAEPSTLTESPVTLAKPVVEENCDEKQTSDKNHSSDQSHSHTPSPVESSSVTPEVSTSQELVEVKYVQLSLSIVLAIVLHAMQSISQFMLEIFLATEQEGHWD